jgi:exoribonuclease-2
MPGAARRLRRYTDLVNQWQIIACARHGKTAALVAPFKPKDAELFAIISSFDAAYDLQRVPGRDGAFLDA